MKFTAIDFETANSDRSSVCAVGMVIVENGKIVGQIKQLIRPVPCRFEGINISIHGITESDVKNAPTFQQYWPQLWGHVSGPLVAHNAAFDMSVLRNALDRSGVHYPDADYFCTRIISKLAWPHYPTHALDYLANALNIPFKHHDPEHDAIACALIALRACEHLSVPTLYDLQNMCRFRVGRIFNGGYTSCSGPSVRHSKRK